jgi:hypothetical protein
MNGFVIRVLAASAAALAWSSSALAGAPSSAPPAVAQPAAAVRVEPPAVIVTPRPARDVITIEERVPNAGLIASGVLMFGLSYGTSVVVAAASDVEADQMLYIPLAGPWMNLAMRGDICRGGACYAGEVGNRVLLVTDGLLQLGGVIQIIGGFLLPEVRTVTRAAERPGVHVAPSAGTGSVGLTAYGRF